MSGRERGTRGIAVACLLVAALTTSAGADESSDRQPIREDDGRTIVLPEHGVRWTVPAESPLRWVDGMVTADRTAYGLIAQMGVHSTGPDAEVNDNDLLIYLTLEVADPARGPLFPTGEISQEDLDAWINGVASSMTREPDAAIAGGRWEHFRLEGESQDKPTVMDEYHLPLPRGNFRLTVHRYGEGVDEHFPGVVEAGLASLAVEDPGRWAIGPMNIAGLRTLAAPREPRDGEGERVEVEGLGFEAVKPPELASIYPDAGGTPPAFTWEGRSEDHSAYLFVHLIVRKKRALDPGGLDMDEYLFGYRQRQWKEPEREVTLTEKRGQVLWQARFARVRGSGYEARFEVYDQPVLEHGYYLEKRGWVYILLIQYGGEDAEKKMERVVRAIERHLRLG